MQEEDAKRLIQNTLEHSFNQENFVKLTKNMLKHAEDAHFSCAASSISKTFEEHIERLERVCKYIDSDDEHVEVLIVYLKKGTSLERARSMQRNFVSKYLNGGLDYTTLIDAALVAFVAPNSEWRFSFVKMEYKLGEQSKIKEEFTSARRCSFLVGAHEKSHTAQSCLLPILCTTSDPTLKELEDTFSVERITSEFFEKYKSLFYRLEDFLKKDTTIRSYFEEKGIDTDNFAKKLLGQIAFLYFLQKKDGLELHAERSGDRAPKSSYESSSTSNIVATTTFLTTF